MAPKGKGENQMKDKITPEMIASCKREGHDIGVYDGNVWKANILVWKTTKAKEEIEGEADVIAAMFEIEKPSFALMGDY